MSKALLLLLHGVTLFLLYPVFAHVTMYELGFFVDVLPHTQFWILVQVFFSGPGLMAIGSFLVVKYKSIYKYWGGVIFVIGLLWLIVLLKTIFEK